MKHIRTKPIKPKHTVTQHILQQNINIQNIFTTKHMKLMKCLILFLNEN